MVTVVEFHTTIDRGHPELSGHPGGKGGAPKDSYVCKYLVCNSILLKLRYYNITGFTPPTAV